MRVLVTGAASGIGRATCLRLARDGRAHGRAAQVAAADLASAAAGLDSLTAEMKEFASRESPAASLSLYPGLHAS